MGNQRLNFRGTSWLINKNKPELGLMNDIIHKYKTFVKLNPEWDEIRIYIMHKGLVSKFSQNQNLKKLLLGTGNRMLTEDSPYDSYWGSGKDKNGQNILGKLLVELRSYLH